MQCSKKNQTACVEPCHWIKGKGCKRRSSSRPLIVQDLAPDPTYPEDKPMFPHLENKSMDSKLILKGIYDSTEYHLYRENISHDGWEVNYRIVEGSSDPYRCYIKFSVRGSRYYI